MKYVLEIRDLSNEGKQISEVKKDYNITSNNLKSNIDILANNHVVAMGAYLKLMYDQVMKITTSLNIESSYGVRLYFNKSVDIDNITLCLTEGGRMKRFKYDEEHGLVNKDLVSLCPLSDCSNETSLLVLIRDWETLKNGIDIEIEKCLERQSENMTKSIKSLEHKENVLSNFAI